MSAKIETGTVVEVDPVKFQFIQAVVLYLIPPDKIEVAPFINGGVPRTGGTILRTDVVKVVRQLSPDEFVKLKGKYSTSYLKDCLKE